MSIVFDNEMMKALEADGEKLRALTGEEHRPYFIAYGEPVPADILKAAEEAFQKALGFVGWDDGVACISEAILAERKRCAYIARNACLVPPDGGSPTAEEAAVCEEAAKRIMGEA